MSLEATAGKNPVSHVGKIYNVLARDIAATIIAMIPEIENAQCLIVSIFGAPVTLPVVVQIKIVTREGVPIADLQKRIDALVGDRIHKRLSFLGIKIRAVHEGVVNTVLVGLRGLVGQLYREDNAHKVRRGLSGRVGQGLNAGGNAYGDAPAIDEKGKRIIVEAEAKIVQRIFEEYVAGRTPREIAYDLNNESISPPRGRSWNASTINGNMQRGTGIIQNELYAGRIVWNKVRMIKDPDTGKRLSRPNAKNDWQTTDVPELRIISQKLFDAAQSRKQARGNTHPNQQRRPHHMLSGLLRCGAAQGCQRTVGISRNAFASAVQLPRRVVCVAMQRHSISLQWKVQFLPGWRPRCGIQA